MAHWLKGIRFYIALGIALLTVEILWWDKTVFAESSLANIRLAEVYAWTSVVFLVLALTIGPLYALLPKAPGKGIAYDARRLLGIGAAWFASLHTLVAYTSLFKAKNPFALPPTYERATLLGILALIVLLAMAFTSFDGAMRKLGVWWYRLHRLVYIAAFATLIHAFMVGSHAVRAVGVTVLSVAATMLVLAHVYLTMRKQRLQWWQLAAVALSILCLALSIRYGLAQHQSATFVQRQAPGSPIR